VKLPSTSAFVDVTKKELRALLREAP